MLEVKLSGCAIIKDDKILLLYRDDHKHYEFPGGKIEKNENRRTTAKRETFEETGLIVTLEKYFGPYLIKNNSKNNGKRKISHVYTANIIDGKIKLENKFDHAKWILLEKYHKYKLAPNVRMFIEDYLSMTKLY